MRHSLTDPCGFRAAVIPRWIAAAATLLGLAFWLGLPQASAATFTASLDRENVTAGESATLTLQVQGGEADAFPALPVIPNLRVDAGGTSRNVSIMNGQVSSTVSQTFLLTPLQPGEYSIPSLSAKVGGQFLATRPVKLTAVKAEAADSAPNQLALMKLVLPKKEIFLGEVIPVELQIYVRDGVANAENILANFDGFNGTPIKAEGFSIIKTAHAQRRHARLGNAGYTLATLVTSVTPVKTGELTLGSIEANLVLQLPSRNQRRRDVFDPFGMFQQYEEQRVVLSAEPQKVTVQPLPVQNVPATFNGAVGEFTLSAAAAPTNVAIGEPITVKIQLSGRGALDSLALPNQIAWRDFKAYPPTAKVESKDPLGLEGSKTFEQVVIPQTADITALPPVSFSYFDPSTRTYKTLSQPAVPLVVRPAGAAPEPSFALSRTAQENTAPSQDIVHIKQRLGSIAGIQSPLVLQPWFLGIQSLPVIMLIAAAAWRRRTEALAKNPRLRRQRQVAHVVRDGLSQLRQLAAKNQSEEFFATLFRLLQEQLGERLDLPASAITEAVLEERLRPRGVPDTTLAPVHELFQTCNAARYAPVKGSQELAAFVPRIEAVLGQLRDLEL